MEFGLDSFGELSPQGAPAQRLRNLVEEVVVADPAGLDVFGVGEHHRRDFVVSAAPVARAVERVLAQMSVGPLAHDRILRAIERFATEVVPAARAAARVDAAS